MMTDRFEQQLPARLTDLVTAPYPDYIEDVLAITAQTPRRPAWSLADRWLPFRVPNLRPVLVLVALLLVLAALAIAVGSRQRLPDPFGPASNGIVAYPRDGGIWVQQVDGTTERIIDGPGDDVFPTFSLDGTKVAFVRLLDDGEHLMAANADGTNVVELLPGPVIHMETFNWSPNSRELAVSHRVAGRLGISIVQADGSGSRRLDLPFAAIRAEWRPPDGQELLVRVVERDVIKLVVIGLDGEVRRTLAASERPTGEMRGNKFNGNWDLLGAAWSPDGSRVAYHLVHAIPGTNDEVRFTIHVVNADGTGDRIVAGTPAFVQDGWPTWSPDGSHLVFQRWQWDGDSWLAIIAVDGAGPARAIGARTRFQNSMGWSVTWSPDQTRILAFWEDEVGGLVSIDPTTGDFERLDWSATDRPAWQRRAPLN